MSGIYYLFLAVPSTRTAAKLLILPHNTSILILTLKNQKEALLSLHPNTKWDLVGSHLYKGNV